MAETIKYARLLCEMVRIPSFSREETCVADLIEKFMAREGLCPRRSRNNVWSINDSYDAAKPTLLLNSHIDTVRPSASYTRDPFDGVLEDGVLHGLGSNDAGASVVSLIAAYSTMRECVANCNLLLALTAEEEVGGENGIRALLPELAEAGIRPDMGIAGEPTSMQAAIGERGLIVLDCTARGEAGHAARNEGDNALYHALDDVATLRDFTFPKVSPTLGPVKISVTQIEAGVQHNVVPDRCRFVVDVRTTDAYSNEETFEMLSAALRSDVKVRSTRVRASVIDPEHPLVKAALSIGAKTYVSPTSSDMAFMSFPSLKIGPGESSRSHRAEEYVTLDEIKSGIKGYIQIIKQLDQFYSNCNTTRI